MKSHSIFIAAVVTALFIGPALLTAQTCADLYKSGSITKVNDLTIGGAAADGNYIFARPAAIEVDSDDNIYVLDYQESHIKKFGPDGTWLKTISRPGQGPGEILRCSQMTMLADDRLVTFDYGNMRFSLFTPDGTFERSVPLKEIFSFRMFPFRIDADERGNIYIETHTILRNSSKGDIYKIWQVSSDFAKAHVVDSCYVKDNEYIRTGNMSSNRIIPFAPRFHWTLLPGGRLATGRAANYEIRIYGPDRSLMQTFTHEADQRRVTNEDKEMFFNGLTYSVSGSNEIKRGATEETREKTKFPSRMPFFSYILADQDGNILCQTSEREDEQLLYDIFSPQGVFIGRVPLPAIGAKAVFKSGAVYALGATDTGEPAVVKYHWE